MTIDYELLKTCIEQDFDPQQNRKAISQEVREFVEKRDAGCRICGHPRFSKLKQPHIMIPHHIKPKEKSVPENLITVCLPCHNYIHQMQTRHVKGFRYHPIFEGRGR